MLPQWLKTSVRKWLERRLPRGTEVQSSRDLDVSGHQIALADGVTFPSGFARLLGRRSHHRAAAWVCPTDGRLYYVNLTDRGATRDEDLPAPAGGRLSCCGDFRLGR